MPGVSAEEQNLFSMDTFMPGSFFSSDNVYTHGSNNGNGEFLPPGLDFVEHLPDSERSSPRIMAREDVNFNNRRFFTKSLSFGSNPSFNDDFPHPMDQNFPENGSYSDAAAKDEAFMSAPNGNYGAMAGVSSDALAALQKFLPSNNEDEASWPAVDVYSCDEFRMYEFKVKRCMRGRSHDWTECPFAHPGEKARRRDPRRFHYSGTACPDFRKGSCRRGDACEFAHGVFECWLHPARYRTQPCKDGRNCRRRVCFFAHTPEQLRLLPGASNSGSRNNGFQANKNSCGTSSYDGSPLRHAVSASASFDGAFAYDGSGLNPANHLGSTNGGYYDGSSPRGGHLGYLCKASQANLSCTSQFQISSPTSTLVGHSHSPPPLSPPLSPSGSPPLSPETSSLNWPLSSPVNNKSLYQKPLNYANFESSSVTPVAFHASLGLQSPRRHLGCVPLLSIPPSHDARGLSSPKASVSILANDGSCTPSPFSQSSSSKAMADLITSLQHLELHGSAPMWLQAHAAHANQVASAAVHNNSPRASNLRHCSYSLPCTPTKSRWENKLGNWEAETAEEPLQRVESGRDLRAKIYGRLSKENPESSESPDLGWVNELVK